MLLPVGPSVGKVASIGGQLASFGLAAYWNVVRPSDGPDAQIRLTASLLFPR